jgi:hypothetical protein
MPWTEADIPDLSGRTAVVTGANGGLGLTPVRGGTRLSSETRVAATDPATRRRFGRYWLVVQPGSSAIRWEVLTAVALRAEGST